jgi:hypothetical protein
MESCSLSDDDVLAWFDGVRCGIVSTTAGPGGASGAMYFTYNHMY